MDEGMGIATERTDPRSHPWLPPTRTEPPWHHPAQVRSETKRSHQTLKPSRERYRNLSQPDNALDTGHHEQKR